MTIGGDLVLVPAAVNMGQFPPAVQATGAQRAGGPASLGACGREDLAPEIIDRGAEPVGERHAGPKVVERPEPRGVAAPPRLPLRLALVEPEGLAGAGTIHDQAGDRGDRRLLVRAEVGRLRVARPLADPDQ